MDVISEVGSSVQFAFNTINQTMFHKDLADLVRGIRSCKGNESQYINVCIQEIKEELKSIDKKERAVAILKLTYLQMIGYNVDWASFKVIEVIAHQKFSQKRIGYLAASQTFSETTDVLVLVTNLIRKDLLSSNIYESGLALDCLSNICTLDLARDLVPDVVNLLNHNKSYIRKKSLLAMYKIFTKFPDALPPSFSRIKDKLDDSEPSVICAAVNVICELSQKNAKNYLPLAPTLFNLLKNSGNNWMLIKVIKLFANLLVVEERLAKRLMEPLVALINQTNSMSLMYEAIRTCIIGLSTYKDVIKTCVDKLRTFIEHPDQNLKYLGLLALCQIMPHYPKAVAVHRDIILKCMEDNDDTIKMRSVELLMGMADRKNLAFIVDKLRFYLENAEGVYKEELLEKIIFLCSQEKYKNISDFDWYINILLDLAHVKGIKKGKLVSDQLFDVCVRVKVERPYAVKKLLELLQEPGFRSETSQEGTMIEALFAAAWIVGEYAYLFTSEEQTKAIDSMTHPDNYTLPQHIQSAYIYNSFKVFCCMLAPGNPDDPTTFMTESSSNPVQFNEDQSIVFTMFEERLPHFISSPFVEVQERSCIIQQLLSRIKENSANGNEVILELQSLILEVTNPVSAQAQERVPLPEGLNLDNWIHEPMPEPEEPKFIEPELAEPGSDDPWAGFTTGPTRTGSVSYGGLGSTSGRMPGANQGRFKQLSPEELERIKKQQENEREVNRQYYLSGNDDVPAKLDESDLPPIRGGPPQSNRGRAVRGRGPMRGGGGARGRGPKPVAKPVSIITEEENPEGWSGKDKPTEPSSKNDNNKDGLSKVDLTKPSESDPDGILQHRQHRTTQPTAAPTTQPTQPTAQRGRGPARGGRVPAPGRGAPNQTTGANRGRGVHGRPAERGGRVPTQGRGQPQSGGRVPARGRGPIRGRGRGGPGRTIPPTDTQTGVTDTIISGIKDGISAVYNLSDFVTSLSGQKEFISPAEEHPGRGFRLQPLARDGNVEITYEYLPYANQNNHIICLFHIHNVSDTFVHELSFSITNINNFRIVPPSIPNWKEGDPIPLIKDLPPSASQDIKLPFSFHTFTVPHDLTGVVTYNSDKTLKFKIHVPVSAFLLPEQTDRQNLTKILRSDAQETNTLSLATTLENALEKIIGVLKLSVVDEDSDKASLYGKSVHGHHVAVLVKKNADDNVAIAVRSNNPTLSSSLALELKSIRL
eukprot:TRINITY_DN6042_c0_g1_i1.p1 TRINITY_DN6042_c0_g1~~TRINITY_DN6042_c0_g1_i1.p1  ORF type:complete len:1211 (-),score=291.67 TRINITY_DN6042_c0_g1_i1:1241-4873(-)